MSYVSTYDKRTPKPKGIALAFGVHAVVIGVVIAMPGIEIIATERGEIEAIQLTKPEPLKEKIEEQKQENPVPQEQRIRLPVPPIGDLPKAPEVEITNFANAGEIALGGGGEDMKIPVEPLEAIEPTPDPIIVEAKLNPRFARQFQPRLRTC